MHNLQFFTAKNLLLVITVLGITCINLASAYLAPVESTTLSTKQRKYIQQLRVITLDETAKVVKGTVYRQSSDMASIKLEIPAWLRKSGLPFSARPEDVWPWGEGKKEPCNSNDFAATQRNITFIPLVLDDDVVANDTTTSAKNVQSEFVCSWDKEAQTFVLCERRIQGQQYYSKYNYDTSKNVDFTAVLAVIPNCESARAFSDAVKDGNKTDNLYLIMGCTVLAVLVLLLCACCCYVERLDQKENRQWQEEHDRTWKELHEKDPLLQQPPQASATTPAAPPAPPPRSSLPTPQPPKGTAAPILPVTDINRFLLLNQSKSK